MCAVPVPETVRSHRSTRGQTARRWMRRALAIGLGLSVFVLAEAACVLFDWGRPHDYSDPFTELSAARPLFVTAEDGQHLEVPDSRRNFFAPESFPTRKDERTFRIFCLGGSTVQGRPYSTPTAFSTWLELSLNATQPDRHWDVVNCGGVSYASYRLVPILQECLGHQPDLIVLCTGHNEFLEDHTYEDIRKTPRVLTIPLNWLSQFRTFCLFRTFVHSMCCQPSRPPAQQQPCLSTEVDALLDYRDGLRAYHRDQERRTNIIRHFEHNLRRMVSMAQSANIPMLLIRPPSNLSDCPPFKSEHRAGLSDAELRHWETLIQDAQAHYRTDLLRAVQRLEQAVDVDDQYAFTFFELGKCRETLGQFVEARAAFLTARELDVCPLRMLEPMEQSLRQVAGDFRVPLVDAHQLLEQECARGILGNGLLVDHVHPSPGRGHQLIATAIQTEMARQGWIHLTDDWQARSQTAFRQHFASLENIYFLRGQRTLKSLQAWCNGRADGPPLESRLPERVVQTHP